MYLLFSSSPYKVVVTILIRLVLLVRGLRGNICMIVMLGNVVAWMNWCLCVHAHIAQHLAKSCTIESSYFMTKDKGIIDVFNEERAKYCILLSLL